ncbi:hypothetical protein QBC44DRAFT_35986 [Cladorrhinum sp. PSN332]|nr:hypothetical protein QBC44DRAFT_35986 [Cladorrhinum sp. PSN332]
MTPPPDLEQAAALHPDWKMEIDTAQAIPPPPVALEQEPRPPSPSAASTHAPSAASFSSLPSIASFAAGGVVQQQQQQGQTRPLAIAPAMIPPRTSPASTAPAPGGNVVSFPKKKQNYSISYYLLLSKCGFPIGYHPAQKSTSH